MSTEANPKGRKTDLGWPSLKQQLEGARVVPGSNLEKLITANQDFSMLAPEELNDGLPWPPWLRVWCRKSHPEINFSPPKVSYPLVLKEILELMVHNQNAPWLATSTTLTGGSSSSPGNSKGTSS